MDIFCVVTGQNESGKSVIVRNTAVKPVSLALLQATSFIAFGKRFRPRLPTDGTPPLQPRYFPPKGGFRTRSSPPPDTTTSGSDRHCICSRRN